MNGQPPLHTPHYVVLDRFSDGDHQHIDLVFVSVCRCSEASVRVCLCFLDDDFLRSDSCNSSQDLFGHLNFALKLRGTVCQPILVPRNESWWQ